jgi:lipopolysaccharide transport system permease protein
MSSFSAPAIVGSARTHGRVLWATTLFELNKKYAGSALGWVWIFLFPLLFLLAYVLVYMVIFRLSLPGLTSLGYVAFVFSGLIPFLTLMEVMTTSVVTIRQNIHLIKNVIVPLELVPMRVVIAAMLVQLAGLALMLVILAFDGALSLKLLLLPVVMALSLLFFLGLALLFAPLGMIVPDLAYVLGIAMNLLMFISPIAFRREQVPELVKFLVDFNPASYLIEAYRFVLLPWHEADYLKLGIFAFLALALFELGAEFLMRYKSSIVDYE